MKLLVLKLATSIAAVLLSTVTFASPVQVNDLLKAETFNTSEFSTLMDLVVTQSVAAIQINQNFVKKTADEILINQTNTFDKVNTKTPEQASLIAE